MGGPDRFIFNSILVNNKIKCLNLTQVETLMRIPKRLRSIIHSNIVEHYLIHWLSRIDWTKRRNIHLLGGK